MCFLGVNFLIVFSKLQFEFILVGLGGVLIILDWVLFNDFCIVFMFVLDVVLY